MSWNQERRNSAAKKKRVFVVVVLCDLLRKLLLFLLRCCCRGRTKLEPSSKKITFVFFPMRLRHPTKRSWKRLKIVSTFLLVSFLGSKRFRKKVFFPLQGAVVAKNHKSCIFEAKKFCRRRFLALALWSMKNFLHQPCLGFMATLGTSFLTLVKTSIDLPWYW